MPILRLSWRHVEQTDGRIHSLPKLNIGDPSIVGLEPHSWDPQAVYADKCRPPPSSKHAWVVQILEGLKVRFLILAKQRSQSQSYLDYVKPPLRHSQGFSGILRVSQDLFSVPPGTDHHRCREPRKEAFA